MTTFEELGLNPEIMKGLDDLGFVEPTSIQKEAIPFILKSKKDLIALAQTGTGKTAAYSLPILNKIESNEKELQTIILCPTRELCLQITQDIKKFAKHLKGVSTTAVYGGESLSIQINALRKGTNIVVGTPGRVHDLIRRNVLKLQSIKWLVLDEADEMLNMGFKDDLDAILSQTPKTRQTFLFSATMSRSVNSIAKQYMTEAQEINIGEKNVGAEKVSHEYYIVSARDRFEALRRILDYLPGVYGIIFCRTKNETQEISDKLKRANYDTEALHGDVSQNIRTKIMDRFKRKNIKLLVATDVAARGIDVNNLTHVINYNLSDQNETYTHRSGRTGRAQNSGVAMSILSPREIRRVRELEAIIGKKFEYKKIPNGKEICRKQMDNFLEEIKTTDIKELKDDQYFSEIAESLKKITKEDLIKHFVTHRFNGLMDDYKNVYDLNAEAKEYSPRVDYGDGTNLEINFGRRHGFDIKGLFSLFNSNKNLNGIKIGRINLMSDCAVFSVDRVCADDVIKHFKGSLFRGKKIIVNKSNRSSGYPSRRRSVQGAGFTTNRRGGFRRSR